MVEITLINSREFNAFVADGRRIFVNVGALMDSKTPNEIIGVLAHETGHITGGHLARLRQRLEDAQTMSIVAMLLGIGAAAGAIATRSDGSAAAGAIMAPQEAIRRSLLSYQRGENSRPTERRSAFLRSPANPPRACSRPSSASTTRSLSQSASSILTHRAIRCRADRISSLEELARKSPNFDKLDPPALQARHDLMRAKLFGFVETPQGRRPALSAAGFQPAGALRPRHRFVSLFGPRRRDPAD